MVRFTVKKPAPTLRLNRVPGDVRPQEETFTLGEVSKALDQVLGEDLLDDLMAIEGFEDLLVQKGYVKKGVDEDLDKLEQEGSVEESIVKPGKGKAEVKKAEQGDDNPIEAPAATDEADEDGDEDDEEISKALGDFADLLDGEGVEVTKGVMAAARKYLRRWRGKGGKYEYQYADDKKGKGGKSPKKPESKPSHDGGSHWDSKGGDDAPSSGLSSDKVSEQKKHIYETADMVDGIKSYTEGYSDKGIEGVAHVDKEKLTKATDRVNADHLALVGALSNGKKLDGDVRDRHISHIDTLVGHGSISEATAKSMKAELKAQAKPDSRPNRWEK